MTQVGALKLENYEEYFMTFMATMMVLYETKIQVGAKMASGCGYASTLTVLVTGNYADQKRENKRRQAEVRPASGNTGRGN